MQGCGEPSSEMGERERHHNNQKDSTIEHDTTLKKFEVQSLKSPPPLSIPAYTHRSIKTKPIVVTEDDALDLSDYFGGSGRSKDTSGGSLDDEVHHGKSLSSSSHHRSIASTIATTPSSSPPPPTLASPFLREELNLAPQSVTAYPTSKSTTTQHRQKPICIENYSSNSTWLENDGDETGFREDHHRIDIDNSLSGYGQQRVYYRTGEVNNAAEGGQPQYLNQISSSSAVRVKRVSFGTVQIRTYETILCDNPSCSNGPSIGIGWRYSPRETNTTVDKLEERIDIVYGGRNPSPEDLVLDRVERETILVNLGYSYQDMAINVRSNVKAKGQRRQTVDNLPVTWFEERGEAITRSVGKVLRRRQSASHLFNEWKEAEQQAKDSVAYKRDMTKR